MKTLLLMIVMTIASTSFAYRPDSSDTSIYNECLWNKEHLQIDVECNDLYNHYKPKKSSYKPRRDVRLGSYNIFRSSQERNKKNLELTAEMIDAEWDIVALSELQPGSTADISSFNRSDDYIFPAYIRILNHLQSLDPSWGMIVSPYAQGTDSEIFGFLYRGNQAKPVESQYCAENYIDNPPFEDQFIYRELTKEDGITYNRDDSVVNERSYIAPKKAIACPLKLEGLYQKRFPKIPLTARFQSGDFEFSYISLHLSFRSYGESDNACLGTCNLSILNLISALSGTDDNVISRDLKKMSSQRANKNIIEALDIIFPKSCADFEITGKGNQSKKAEYQKKYNSCKEKFNDYLSKIGKLGVSVPDSCAKIKTKQETVKQYEACEDDIDYFKGRELESLMDTAFTIVNQHLETDDSFAGNVASIFKDFGKDSLVSKGEGRELNRYFQSYTVLREASTMSEVEDSNDVIVGGDFNLEKIDSSSNHWRAKAWNQALAQLPGSELLIEEKTSLNSSRKHGKNYDHFILVNQEGVTDECDTSTAQAIDFVNEDLVLSNGFKLGSKVAKEDYHFVMSDHLPISMTCLANSKSNKTSAQ